LRIINIIKKIINLLNIDIKKYPNLDLRRRRKLLEYYNISKVLDVGANSGQYATELFKIGYSGKIVSFEPVKSVYKKLNEISKNNKKWTTYNFGLGNKEEEMLINISENTYSSSLLDIMPSHVEGAPESKYINKETVQIKTLDSVFNDVVKKDDVVLLKMDVQGFEKNVLEGAINSLKNIKGIQLEMSIEELYKGEMLFDEMIAFLKQYNFSLHSLENGYFNKKTGKLLQVDGVFFRK